MNSITRIPFALCLCTSVTFALAVMTLLASHVAAKGLLRDAGIENALARLAEPVLAAANLDNQNIRLFLVDDRSLNAFVINNQAIFLNYGLVLHIDTPEMLQAIIAHEAAHIANGHIARRTENFRHAQSLGLLGTALAITSSVATSPDVATGLAVGTSSASVRSFLKHTRAEEAAADQSALLYMQRAGINPEGLLAVHQLFRRHESLIERRHDLQMRSHPLTSNRLRAAETFVSNHGEATQPNPEHLYLFARMRGKLSAFTRSPEWTRKQLDHEPYADIRFMRQATAYHKELNTEKAVKTINAALDQRGNRDGFYFDLKGQILLEGRRFDEALMAYQRARELEPHNGQILGGLGRAQLAVGDFSSAIKTLEKAHAQDRNDLRVLQALGQSYGQVGKIGEASLVTAERYALQGRFRDSYIQAKRASDLLPTGSTRWKRAQNLLIATKNIQN